MYSTVNVYLYQCKYLFVNLTCKLKLNNFHTVVVYPNKNNKHLDIQYDWMDGTWYTHT